MRTIHLELRGWTSDTVSNEGFSDSVTVDISFMGKLTVKEFLGKIATDFPVFGQRIFDSRTKTLNEQVNIFINRRCLELENGLLTLMNDGDTLLILPVVEGG